MPDLLFYIIQDRGGTVTDCLQGKGVMVPRRLHKKKGKYCTISKNINIDMFTQKCTFEIGSEEHRKSLSSQQLTGSCGSQRHSLCSNCWSDEKIYSEL